MYAKLVLDLGTVSRTSFWCHCPGQSHDVAGGVNHLVGLVTWWGQSLGQVNGLVS